MMNFIRINLNIIILKFYYCIIIIIIIDRCIII